MPNREVSTVRDAEIKTFSRADSFYYCAPTAQVRANSVKVCGNTYLRQLRDNQTGGGAILGYALAFHGSDIVKYMADGSYVLNMHGYTTPTTRHRIDQFSPFRVSQVKGTQYVQVPHNGQVVALSGYLPGRAFDPNNSFEVYKFAGAWAVKQ